MRTLLAATLLAVGTGTFAAPTVYTTTLGPEVPGATGSGTVSLVFDDTTLKLRFDVDWTGLTGVTTVAHIHCCTAVPGGGTIGVAVTPGTLPGFPAGVTTGSYDAEIDLDAAGSYTAAFLNNFGGGTVVGARNALLAGMSAGTAYFNIHTNVYPAGEIRGFVAVPEPATWALAALALGVAGATRRRLSAAG